MARKVAVEASVRDRMTSRVERMERSVQKFGRTFDRTGRMTARASRLMARGMTFVERGLSRLWRRARLAGLALQVTASIMGGMAIKAAMDYERALRQVFTLMDDAGSVSAEATRKFQEMDATLRAMSTRVKQTPQALAAGLYDVVSTGFEAADATVVLEAAAKGAYAGLTDVDTAAALLTQTLQAFRQEGESSADMAAQASGMMDMFFNAVNVGVFTFEELAEKFGDVASTAAAFGVSLEDLLSFLSTATVRGVGLDEAITSARQTLLSIASATPATEKALVELFGSSEKAKESFSAQALAEQGLIGVMEDLSAILGTKIDKRMIELAASMDEEGAGGGANYLAEQIGISVEAFTDLFPNIRALKGVLAVSGPGLKTYGEHYEEIATNMGSVDRAAKEIDKSASGALQGLKAVWEQFKIDVGGIALPWIKSISDNLVEWWGGLPERFAQEQGLFTMPGMSIEADQQQADELGRMWAAAAPGEKIGFILRTAWSDALDNLTTWFDTGGGKEKITSLGERIGGSLGSMLSRAFGIDSAEVEDSIFYKIGSAAAEGFMDGFKANFSLGAVIEETLAGDSVLGSILSGALIWKIVKANLGKGPIGTATTAGSATGAATATGAAAGAGGGLLARMFGGVTRTTAIGLGLLNAGAVQSDLAEPDQHSMIMRALGMFGIGSQSVWGGPNREERAQMLDSIGPGVTAQGRHVGRTNQRDRLAESGRRIGDGADRIEGAGTTMRGAAALQYSAALRMDAATRNLSRAGLTAPGGVAPPMTGGRQEALGSIGTVRKPTHFIAGEMGAEDFEFTPHRGGKRAGGARGKSLSVAGPLIGHVTVANDYDVKKLMAQINREIEKAFGNG